MQFEEEPRWCQMSQREQTHRGRLCRGSSITARRGRARTGGRGCVVAFLCHRGQGYIHRAGNEGPRTPPAGPGKTFWGASSRPQTKEQATKLSCSFPQAPQVATCPPPPPAPHPSTRDHQAQGPVSAGSTPSFHSSSWNQQVRPTGPRPLSVTRCS